MVSIPACHAGDLGSIPRRGEISRCNGAIILFKQNLKEFSNIRKRNCKFGDQSYEFTFGIEPSDPNSFLGSIVVSITACHPVVSVQFLVSEELVVATEQLFA